MRNRYGMVMLGLAVAAATTGCSQTRSDSPADRLRGQMAPEIALTALDGETVRLSSFRGRPAIVSFFATW